MHRNLAANDELRSRFRREARICGALSHPNLVNALLFSEFQQGELTVPFLALEYLDGLSLRSALLARGALSVARTLHILLQVADAVGEAHQHGIVHRDLKPDNVMLVQRGDDPDFVKVLDFGVARADQGAEGQPSITTNAGAIFGSARYVAPECAAGGASSPASDVYALATLAYECLLGRAPFDGENAIQVLLQQQSQAVPPLLEQNPRQAIPSALADFIERNLAKAPEARARDARVFARELLNAAREAGADPGLSSRTRRGHAALPALSTQSEHLANPDLPALAQPSTATRPVPLALGGAARRALIVLLCFVIGAGAAIGIAKKVGAFTDQAKAIPGHLQAGTP
jgi:serine/threonine-protein kinase